MIPPGQIEPAPDSPEPSRPAVSQSGTGASGGMSADRGYLDTEQRNPDSETIDTLSIPEAFEVMASADRRICAAVDAAREPICRAIELVSGAFAAGHRLFYVGAGTSGRLGVLDASECPPTFLSDPRQVQGIIAGGDAALKRSIEGAEDSRSLAEADLTTAGVAAGDVVMGITTGGTTPYVHAAIETARAVGAATVFMACVPTDQVEDRADVSIRVLTGPEVVTGSTRLKAGTATKLVLNRITTLAMIRSGKVYRNLMVDVDASRNAKLVDRGIRILQAVTGLTRSDADELLRRAGFRVKTAIVMHELQIDAHAANDLLAQHDGRIREILPDR